MSKSDDNYLWFDASKQPEPGSPVLAQYHPWDDPKREIREHVVWWHTNTWRPYPTTGSYARVLRWRYLSDLPTGWAEAALAMLRRVMELDSLPEIMREEIERLSAGEVP